MSKYIFGSGIVGMLAKEILGADWAIIPFSRSRFFSFNPALDDNYIVHDEKIADFMGHLGTQPTHMYKMSYSVLGQLEDYNSMLCDAWLGKVFGDNPPPQAAAYMKSRTSFFVYDVRINQLYQMLQNKYAAELEQNSKLKITSIGDHHFIANGQRYDFDTAISTIPLTKLTELCGIPAEIETKQVWYYHIETPDLDFEGANQTLVVDPEFIFYKVINVAKNRYIFHCLQDISIPGPYFMQFMSRFNILDGTTIENVIPVGARHKLRPLRRQGIICVGAHAEHDWCADVGSNIMGLLRVKNRAH